MALSRGATAAAAGSDGAERQDATVTAAVGTAVSAATADAVSSSSSSSSSTAAVPDVMGAAAARLSLSDGEQLVDAEHSDSLLEIDLGFPAAAGDRGDYSPVLELFPGTPGGGSAERERSEMDTLPGGDAAAAAADHYFYI